MIMTIVFIIIGIVIFLGFLEELSNRFKAINWVKLFSVLIIGGILLAIIFSFTAEGVLVIIGAYVTLVFLALLFGVFSKKENDVDHIQDVDQGRYKIAKNLLDILDDETIAKKTELPLEVIKSLRLKN